MFKRTGIPFHFHQLDNKTREIMKEELEMDLNGNGPYQSPRLNSEGLRQFPDFLKKQLNLVMIFHFQMLLDHILKVLNSISEKEDNIRGKSPPMLI